MHEMGCRAVNAVLFAKSNAAFGFAGASLVNGFDFDKYPDSAGRAGDEIDFTAPVGPVALDYPVSGAAVPGAGVGFGLAPFVPITGFDRRLFVVGWHVD